MRSLNIKQLAERSNQVIASAILINYPAVAATATTILSGYFILATLTDCSISIILLNCAGSVPLLDLFYC